MILRTFAVLVALVLLSGCARVITQDEFETCLWGGAVAGAAVGSFGGVAGSAGGAAAGAAIGAFTCGDVGPDQPAVEPVLEKPLDSDGDGVPDSHDRCAGTPTGVKVDRHGCPRDSDGDGVADYLDQCPGTSAGVAVDKTGCPLAGEVLMTLRGVNFAHDSVRLTGGSQAILDAAVQVLQQNRKVSVDVVGHTDSQGSEAYNQGLSERRASAVRDYLIANGIDGNRLHARGEGESSPLASNDTPAGRASNRRVELVTQ